MKRKKWTEEEEETLINRYSELLNSGTLTKLKTREKKFEPIADHVNSIHHFQDPVNYPFLWSWRDVSIKVQNMRHQYLGVKQKIRVSDDEFNWKDGENHWQNFLKYKEVFGDVELLEVKDKGLGVVGGEDDGIFGYESFVDGVEGGDILGIGLGLDCEDLEDDDDDDGGGGGGAESDGEDCDDLGLVQSKRLKRSDWGGLGLMGAQVLELRDMVVRREERVREREFNREEAEAVREQGKRDREKRKEEKRKERDDEWMESKEFEWEEMQKMWARREFEHRLQLKQEFDEERRRRMRMEEEREEEEMEWRGKMVGMQIEHEKQMMQMHADASQNQMQIMGVLVRLMCQFIGPTGNDAMGGGGLGGLAPHQVLQNLQHPGSLVGDNGKPDDGHSPSSHFM